MFEHARARGQKFGARVRYGHKRLSELERQASFGGGYLTRALAEERVRRRREEEEAEEEDVNVETPRRLGGSMVFLAGMPIIAKLALLLALSTVFLRMGSVTFGGGFVMVPLIESEVVRINHWLTQQEFADATALGQLTPGPVLITATFIGYRVAGTLGALVAAIAVFLPAFLMTIAAGSSLRRFRSNRQVQAFLRGVTPAVVGLLAAAAWTIGRAGIHSWVGVTIAAVAVVVLLRYRPNPFWIIFGAGALRLLVGRLLA